MSTWKINTQNEITIITEAEVNLKAYYILESSTETDYTEISGTWETYGDRYVLITSFDTIGEYILKIVDLNGKMEIQASKLIIVDLLDNEVFDIIQEDVFDIKTDTTLVDGLSVVQATVDNLENYDDSETQTKLDALDSKQFGLTAEEHDKLLAIVNYDDKQLKNLAYAILGA